MLKILYISIFFVFDRLIVLMYCVICVIYRIDIEVNKLKPEMNNTNRACFHDNNTYIINSYFSNVLTRSAISLDIS